VSNRESVSIQANQKPQSIKAGVFLLSPCPDLRPSWGAFYCPLTSVEITDKVHIETGIEGWVFAGHELRYFPIEGGLLK
jgi:hypothetical protein